MILPAVLLDATANVLHNARQRIAADVRMCIHQDAFLRPERHQLMEHLADVPALGGTRIELAVGESAGTALAETIVRIGIDDLPLAGRGNVGLAPVHVLAPFQHDGPATFHQEPQRREHARRPAAHDDDRRRR